MQNGRLNSLLSQMQSFLEEKKAQKVLILDFSSRNLHFDYFCIASLSSVLHLAAVIEEMNRRFKTDLSSHSQNTHEDIQSGWVILDCFETVIHLFLKEQRSFYQLERLWGDAKILYPFELADQDKQGIDYLDSIKLETEPVSNATDLYSDSYSRI